MNSTPHDFAPRILPSSSSPFALLPPVKSKVIIGHPWLKSLGCGFLLCALSLPLSESIFAAVPGEEQKLIQVLKSDASPHDKEAACARLKRIGTVESIPALST